MYSIEVGAEVAAALDALDAGDAAIGALHFDALSPTVRLRVLERMEASRRRQIALSHDLIAGLSDEEPASVGGPIHQVIADCLRISYAEARRRVKDAEQLTGRTTLTGEELPPELAATATVWRAGKLDAQHLRVIQAFVRDLPDATPADAVEDAERFLAEQATKLRPDQLQRAAHRLALHINPDGKFSDADRARRRGFAWCGQRSDGMSIGKLVASPELRANLDAWLARFAAPGMCNPDDEYPCTTGEPAEEAVGRNARTPGQRQHDALNALVRGQLGDPKLGQHNGLPVSVIVSTTLQELTTGAGRAVTGGGTLLPMRDVIRMASHAPTTTLPYSTTIKAGHCISADRAESPYRISAWSCTPRTAAVRTRAATLRAIGAKSTTSRNGPAAAQPMSTISRSRVDPTTNSREWVGGQGG